MEPHIRLTTQLGFNVALDVTHGTAAGEGLFRQALSEGAYSKLRNPTCAWTLDLRTCSASRTHTSRMPAQRSRADVSTCRN